MRVLVVVPTYNEALSLERVVTGVLNADADVLVVDDGSPDGSGALADRLAAENERVRVLHRPAKAGLGSAYRTGFRWGLAQGFDLLCEMDADLSHDPADVPRLIAAAAQADLVIGSRYVPGGTVVDWPPHRRALSRVGNRYARLATGLPVTDSTSGFRVFRRAVLEAIDLDTIGSEGYSFQIEMALRAWRLGFRISELPITFVERREGASKISRAIVFEALWRILQWGIAGPRRPPQRPHRKSVAAV
ncbi:MAG TPA: polyprenol monophosphomannose synthase [Egibacteraceae bacterium]|nr:polyprenol monophosphomannose synthase [Egibacteraceae bacterium]